MSADSYLADPRVRAELVNGLKIHTEYLKHVREVSALALTALESCQDALNMYDLSRGEESQISLAESLVVAMEARAHTRAHLG